MDPNKVEESESEYVFKSQIDEHDASYHIQREEYEKFKQLMSERKAAALIDNSEYEQLGMDLEEDQLKYSNDMVIDLIIEKVYRHTEDKGLKKAIDCMKIGNLPIHIPGRFYQKYFDDSFFISLGRSFLLIIRQASDIMACLFLNDYKPIEPQYSDIFLFYISILVGSISEKKDEQYEPKYSDLQYYMKYIDDHVYCSFTDVLVFISRGVEETAKAFLIGHELGHHVLGHTTKLSPLESPWDMEYAADEFAFDFAIEYLDACMEEKVQLLPPEYVQIDSDITYRLAGIIIVFAATKLYSKEVSAKCDSHPPIDERVTRIWGFLKEKYGNSIVKSLQEYMERFENIISSIEKLHNIRDSL